MPDNQDIRLIIKIDNSKPLELLELTKSFVSLANQFNSFVADSSTSTDREAKLYVKEIKSGSIILELYEFATQSALPFIENINTIVGFAGYLKEAYNFFLGKTKESSQTFTHNDYKELSQIVNPVANDNASQINISTTVNNKIDIHLTLNSTEANAIQNIIQRQDKELKSPAVLDDAKTKVLLTLFQTRADTSATTGNKGTIEEISSKAIPLIFDTEEINQKMLHQDFSPYEKIFVVDVKIQHVGGKIAAYKITNFHEALDKE